MLFRSKIMSEHTDESYVFRTDLRLRPDPGATPIAIPLTAALSYYESMGQNWERAAFIKARPVAGETLNATTFRRIIGSMGMGKSHLYHRIGCPASASPQPWRHNRLTLADIGRHEGERIATGLADTDGFGRRSPDRQRAERAGRQSQQWLESHRRFLPLAVPVPVALLAFAGFAGLFLLADLLPANLRADLSLSRSLLVALSSGDMLPRSTTP